MFDKMKMMFAKGEKKEDMLREKQRKVKEKSIVSRGDGSPGDQEEKKSKVRVKRVSKDGGTVVGDKDIGVRKKTVSFDEEDLTVTEEGSKKKSFLDEHLGEDEPVTVSEDEPVTVSEGEVDEVMDDEEDLGEDIVEKEDVDNDPELAGDSRELDEGTDVGEKESGQESVDEDTNNGKDDDVVSAVEEGENNNSNKVRDSFRDRMREREDGKRKKELVEKKHAEYRRQVQKLLDEMPPTSDTDEIIDWALNNNIDEWVLRDLNIMNDTGNEEDFEEDVSVPAEAVERAEGDIVSDEDSDLLEGDAVDVSSDVPGELTDGSGDEEVGEYSNGIDDVGVGNDFLGKLKEIAKVKKRVVSVSDNDDMLVKEEKKDSKGNLKHRYRTYRSDEGKVYDVGDDVSDDVGLVEVVDNDDVLIDGEVYNVDREDEEKILDELGYKEVWLVDYDTSVVSEKKKNLLGTKYTLKVVEDDKSFMLATRKSDSLLVITQRISKDLKPSIAGYLKYVREEKRKFRLVTLKESPVRAGEVEEVLGDLDEKSLDKYFRERPAEIYNKSLKSAEEVLKGNTFDITHLLK